MAEQAPPPQADPKESRREKLLSRVRTPGKRPTAGAVSSTAPVQSPPKPTSPGAGPPPSASSAPAPPPESTSPGAQPPAATPPAGQPPSAPAPLVAPVDPSLSPGDANEEDEAKRERRNWQLHVLYTKKDFRACASLADAQLQLHPKCEYALYIKALMKRHQGEIQESLKLFEQCFSINPCANNIKQIARSYFLLGKHKTAITAFEKAERLEAEDWETWHNKGLCYMYLKDTEMAAECFRKANTFSRHDCTYMQLGRLYISQENYKLAIDVFLEALEFSPENPDILTTLGLLYLRTGENYRAFDYFGNALTQDPINPKTILAAGSIIQDHSEVEVALIKYRIAAVQTPHSAQLWNNIGMCFFSKQKYVAAIASLKKALYYAPFEWIISYNLGLVHLHTGQYASAFHFFSAAINLKPDFPITYMHLAITLSRLGDYRNACTAYDKALEIYNDPLVRMNYAILHYTYGEMQAARSHFNEFEKQYATLDEEARTADYAVVEQRSLLIAALFPDASNAPPPLPSAGKAQGSGAAILTVISGAPVAGGARLQSVSGSGGAQQQRTTASPKGRNSTQNSGDSSAVAKSSADASKRR